jgi:chemotaxis protein CheZ
VSAILSEVRPVAAMPALPQDEISSFDVFQRVGMLTRKLHDALRELGYDQQVGDAVSTLPDARARLGYIATLTGQAAERVLSTAETGMALQERVGSEARTLESEWKAVAGSVEESGALAEVMQRTRSFLRDMQGHASTANSQFTDIMLAQDFHDLTGQVLNKVVILAQNLEEQLLKLLVEATPPEQRTKLVEQPGLAGPVIDAAGNDDVVTSQAQVDDLLESLGF